AKMMWGCTRPILMDNGVHENGEPAPLEDICKADQLIRADYVIPPDKFHDSEYTKAKFLEAKERISVERLWPVVQARSLVEAEEVYRFYIKWNVKAVCLPYRAKWRMKFIQGTGLYTDVHHHFLGVNHLLELPTMNLAPHPSVDTGKPFRYAQ